MGAAEPPSGEHATGTGGWDPHGTEPETAFPVPWTWFDALVAFLLSLVAGFAAGGGVAALAEGGALPQDLVDVVVLPVALAILALAVLLVVRTRYPGQLWRLRGPAPPRWADIGTGIGLGLLAYLAINIGLGLLLQTAADLSGTELPTVQEQFQEAARDPQAAPLFALGAVLAAPIAEELFFRGMLFQTLRRRLGLWPGIGISSALFGLAHSQPGAETSANLLVFVIIFPLGMALAWAFHRRGTLLVPILMHAVFNAIGVLALMVGAG